jgi:hypothetical protein
MLLEINARGAFHAAKLGRPSIPPGVYFRMILVGYFEGIASHLATSGRSPRTSKTFSPAEMAKRAAEAFKQMGEKCS